MLHKEPPKYDFDNDFMFRRQNSCKNALSRAPALIDENKGSKSRLALAVALANHGSKRFVPAWTGLKL
jgi:hypothetical protein